MAEQWTKERLLENRVVHVDPTAFDARPIVESYRKAAFQARNLARACDIVDMMAQDKDCAVILTLAGSLVSAGMKEIIIKLLEANMVDAIVSTGANVVDQDFFEGLGFAHYIAPGSPENPVVADETLRDLAIDRIYDTYINEDELRICDDTMFKIFNEMTPGAKSSREVIAAMGAHLAEHHPNERSFVRTAYDMGVPIYVPALSDCSAGFGIVLHQFEAEEADRPCVAFDSGKDFKELTEIKMATGDTGLLMMGGGVPKNFAQDIVVAAELRGHDAPMHKYAVQLTVADSRDGALSGSTLREACSWGKVDTVHEQMVFGEVTTLLPILASDLLHRGSFKARKGMRLSDRFAARSTANA